tara:strand:- start:1111 stop:1527 length:417 start_codon:yes stop_codon:yes gene_type:complete
MIYKIYKIVDNTNGNTYIGNTNSKRLCERIAHHKYRKDCTSRIIFLNKDYYYEQIDEINGTKDDARKLEQRYMDQYKDNLINKQKAWVGLTKKEYDKLQNKSEYKINYRKRKYAYEISFGGDKRNNNNLLFIDTNLFN